MLVGQYASNFIYSIRVILTIRVTEQAITMLDIGTHDEVYRHH